MARSDRLRRGSLLDLDRPIAADVVRQRAADAGLTASEYAAQQAEIERRNAAARDAARRLPTEDEFVLSLETHFRMDAVPEPTPRSQIVAARQQEVDSLQGLYELPARSDQDRQPARPGLFAEVGEIAVGPDLTGLGRDDTWYTTLLDIQAL